MSFKQLFPVELVDYTGADSIHLYTDGSCLRNGEPDACCGWAYIVTQKNKDTHISRSGGWRGGTNNQAEMTAAIEGLRAAGEISYTLPITLYSDSKYVIETLKGNFSIKKNHQLWQILFAEARKFLHIQFEWVRGHSDNPYNNEVDRMAIEQSRWYETYS